MMCSLSGISLFARHDDESNAGFWTPLPKLKKRKIVMQTAAATTIVRVGAAAASGGRATMFIVGLLKYTMADFLASRARADRQ